jgi:hypothetical protein
MRQLAPTILRYQSWYGLRGFQPPLTNENRESIEYALALDWLTFVDRNPWLRPGSKLLLEILGQGTGADDTVRAQIEKMFEPGAEAAERLAAAVLRKSLEEYRAWAKQRDAFFAMW